MKSIIEEASSISKAIENGWIRAGKPQEFTIRIFEEPEKNFIGFTKKPAKVGIFYQESFASAPHKHKDSKKGNQPKAIQQKVAHVKTQQEQKNKQSAQQAPQTKQAQPAQSQQQAEKPVIKWTQDTVDNGKQWLDKILKIMKKDSIRYSVQVQNEVLHIHFDAPLIEDKRKELVFFRNAAYLLLQFCRHTSKRGLRHCKVMISSAA